MLGMAVAILVAPLVPGIVLITLAASRRQEGKPSRLMLLGVRTLIVGVLVSGYLIVSLSKG